MDKMIISATGTPFDTRSFSGLKYDGSKFSLDVPRIFNNSRKLLNAGANYERVLRCGYASWDGMGQTLDWQDSDYFPLMRQYLELRHQPFQGANPPPGKRIWFEMFNGNEDKNLLADPLKARIMMQTLFSNLGDLIYVDFSVGNEMESAEWCEFVINVVYPEFKSAGRIPFAYGASHCQPGMPFGPMEKQKAAYDKLAGEDAALKVWRPVHGVCDSNSENLLIAKKNWLKTHSIQQIRTILSVDGIWQGASPDDMIVSNGKTQRRPSHAQMQDAINCWLSGADNLNFKAGGPAFGFEYLPKAQVDDISVASVEAISDMYKKHFGTDPENRGKYPLDWVDPVIPPVEPPVIIPDEPLPKPKIKVTWQFWVGLGALAVLIVLGMLFLKGC